MKYLLLSLGLVLMAPQSPAKIQLIKNKLFICGKPEAGKLFFKVYGNKKKMAFKAKKNKKGKYVSKIERGVKIETAKGSEICFRTSKSGEYFLNDDQRDGYGYQAMHETGGELQEIPGMYEVNRRDLIKLLNGLDDQDQQVELIQALESNYPGIFEDNPGIDKKDVYDGEIKIIKSKFRYRFLYLWAYSEQKPKTIIINLD